MADNKCLLNEIFYYSNLEVSVRWKEIISSGGKLKLDL